MLNEERIVREICEMWSGGKEPVKEAWRKYGSEDLVWWNSARGELRGRAACEAGVDAMFDMLNVTRVRVPIRAVAVQGTTVFIERSDDLYLADGTCLVEVPVVGVVQFEGDKIVEWRDYCDDWMRDLRPDDAPRALA